MNKGTKLRKCPTLQTNGVARCTSGLAYQCATYTVHPPSFKYSLTSSALETRAGGEVGNILAYQ